MPAATSEDINKGWVNGKRPEGGFSFIMRSDTKGNLTDFTAVTASNYAQYKNL